MNVLNKEIQHFHFALLSTKYEDDLVSVCQTVEE